MEIKSIVEGLGITEKRERLMDNTLKIFQIKSDMSKLTFNREVGLYVFDRDKIAALEEEGKEENRPEIDRLKAEARWLSKKDDVIAYNALQDTLDILKEENQKYYQSIQIDLREELLNVELPEIFVYQGALEDKSDLKLCRHIVSPSSIMVFYKEGSETIVYPMKPEMSQREARHFYNRTSFRYLEQLSKDHSFSLKGKKLGKVKTLNRGY